MAPPARLTFTFLLLSVIIAFYLSRNAVIENVEHLASAPARIQAILSQAQRLSTHSWEYATAAEAALELFDPELTVFGRNPFPNNSVPYIQSPEENPALKYIKPLVYTSGSELQDSPATVGDPPSLGPFALLLGQTEEIYGLAATRQIEHILTVAPRWRNDAISHWRDHAELWADFVYMTPPFLAYSAVARDNITLMAEAYRQIRLYRSVLRSAEPEGPGHCVSLWRHIEGPMNSDPGFWTTSIGWALGGMLRVYATMTHWESSQLLVEEMSDLRSWILELITAVMCTVDADTGHPTYASTVTKDASSDAENDFLLLRNYLTDPSYFRETSGTALVAASIFRAAVLFSKPSTRPRYSGPSLTQVLPYIFRPSSGVFPLSDPDFEKWLQWAHSSLRTILSPAHLDNRTGIVGPAVYALDHFDRRPLWSGSAEGQSFVVMAWSAWRDCQIRGVCSGALGSL